MRSTVSKNRNGFLTLEGILAIGLSTIVVGGLGRVWARERSLILCERALFRRAHSKRMASIDDEVRVLGSCCRGRRELVLKSLERHNFARGTTAAEHGP